MKTDDDDTNQPKEPSLVAQEVARLKRASFKAAEVRERLPQPLFWSVFGQQLNEIRQLKAKVRAIESVLSGGVTEAVSLADEEM